MGCGVLERFARQSHQCLQLCAERHWSRAGAAADRTRADALLAAGSLTRQAWDALVTAETAARASLAQANAGLIAAQENGVAARGRLDEARARYAQATTGDAQVAAAAALMLAGTAMAQQSAAPGPAPTAKAAAPHDLTGYWVAVVTEDWRDVVNDPEIDIVAELIGGISVAREVVDASIAAGKHVTRLALTWKDRVSFVLTDQMLIKRVNFLEVLRNEGGEEDQDPDEKFDIDFALMTGELAKCIADLAEALGRYDRALALDPSTSTTAEVGLSG